MPPINVSDALHPDTAIVLTVTRRTGGYVNGIWALNPNPETFTSLCSFQQPTPQQLLNLDENERKQDIRIGYFAKQVHQADDRLGTPADEVTYKGQVFKVIAAGDWEDYGYCIATLALEAV